MNNTNLTTENEAREIQMFGHTEAEIRAAIPDWQSEGMTAMSILSDIQALMEVEGMDALDGEKLRQKLNIVKMLISDEMDGRRNAERTLDKIAALAKEVA